MKTFRQIISEVAQPRSGDEQNFKDKHEIEFIDHPESEEGQHTASTYRKRRIADYDEYEDKDVYEAAKYAKNTSKSDDGEGLDPVGAEDDDVDNDGDVDSSDKYLKNRRNVIKKAIKKASMNEKLKADHKMLRSKYGADWRKKAGINEEVELDEQSMTFQNAEKLKNKHLVAMDHHKKSGNSKGYVAHSMVVRKFEDAYDRHGTGIIPAGRILSASQKAFKDHPHSSMNEKAVSQSQQKLMGMALAYKRGEMDDASEEVKKIADGMSEKDLEDFAKTKHKGLPKKVNENAWEEIPMMTRQLNFIMYAAEEITEYLNDCDDMCVDPEEWFQNKLAHIHGQMTTLHAYVEGERRMGMYGESLDEAVEVRHDRYMRTHGKKARNQGGSSTWMFTNKDMGDVDYNNEKEVHTARGNFSDAKKSAQLWAKKHGYREVYVMEETELDEVSFELAKRARDKGFEKMAKSIGSSRRKPSGGNEYVPASDDEMSLAQKGARQAKMASRAMNRAFNKQRTGRYESVSYLNESFKAGDLELKDGSIVSISVSDAKLLNQMMKDMNAKNRKEMKRIAMTDEAGFEEILGFAREAL